ncbi:MAG: ribonuclease P protein component [Candidatus Aminicenantes bacterium]|jgi:ribonuclease P protein component
MNESLRSHERLRKRKDFLHIYRNGKRFRGKYFTLIYLSNRQHSSRMAVVASKKIGDATVRNRVKRRLRALYRKNKGLLQESFDLVFITKKDIVDASWIEIQTDYIKALRSLRLS